MNLYLVQHAEAKPKEKDPERGLSEKGLSDLRRVAIHVAAHSCILVNLILHSGKKRAKQTVEVLAEYLNPPDGIKAIDGLEPLADASIWKDRLKEINQDTMLVGHLPHLSKLTSSLLCNDDARTTVNFKNSGIVCLKRDDSGSWSIGWMLTPQIL